MKHLRPQEAVAENFRRVLPRLLQRYFRRGHKLVRARAANEKLHRFRIRTKRIRYVVELYEEVFPGPLRGSLKRFREIQEVLGLLQDQAMLELYLKRLSGDGKARAAHAGLALLLPRCRARQKDLRRQFFMLWKTLEKSGFEKHLTNRIRRTRLE